MGVTKVVLGEPSIAQSICNGGVEFLADSRIDNIIKMKNSGVIAKFVLLRTTKNDAKTIVQNVDISLNTEIETLEELSKQATKYNIVHKVIIMVELGDLREGVMPYDVIKFIKKVNRMTHIKIIGLGCNLACFAGVKPDRRNMNQLTQLVDMIEKKFNISMKVITGGNSSNYNWFQSDHDVGAINNLRIGESIFLGLEPLYRKRIFGLHTDAFRLFGEVVESKLKPSIPTGNLAQNGFGEKPLFLDRGLETRVIIALGRQDVDTPNLKLTNEIEILGSSSDHLIINPKKHIFKIGDEVEFGLSYSGLLTAMTSPFVKKVFNN